MKRTLFTAALVGAVLAGSALPVSAQAVSIQANVLKDWTDMKDTMMKIADAMPEDKFTYKSTPAQRNYGEQILHVAQVNVGLLGALAGKAMPPKFDAKATKKADILKAMADSFDYGEALIREQTDASMFEIVPTNPFLGPSSRARVIYFLIPLAIGVVLLGAVELRQWSLRRSARPVATRPATDGAS